MQTMHDSFKRLLDFAKAATAQTGTPIRTPKDLGTRLDVSDQTRHNWTKRGVSRDGALEAERRIGCSAQWVLDGKGIPQAPAAGLHAAEPSPPHHHGAAPSLAHTLQQLLHHLAGADALTRAAIGPLMHRLVVEPNEADSISDMISALMAARRKRA